MPGESRLRENCTSGSEGRAEVAAVRTAASPDPTPAKPPNNARGRAAEAVEGRGSAKGNAAGETRPGRRAGQGVPSELGRVRRAARKDRTARFTALLHHVSVDRCGRRIGRLSPRPRRGWMG
jgi:RNA-directed DNA polymerase